MDIEMILSVLERHGVKDMALAHDIQTMARECYLDGKFDGEHWWVHQDQDDEWVAQWDVEVPGDVPSLEDLKSFDKIMQEKKDENGSE